MKDKLQEEQIKSSLSNSFNERFSANNQLQKTVTKIERTGKLMFKPEDIYKTTDPLARILRIMFVENHITENYFDECHERFARNTLNFESHEITTQRNNWKNAAYQNKITFKFLENMIMILFQYQLLNLELTFMDNSGEVKKYSLAQADDLTGIES